jgi:hypothetical protein
VRAWTGTGSQAKVRWNGRTASGQLAPAGWATITVTATAGGATARPATSRVFVNRTAPPSGTSTGGFSAGTWTVSNVNAEQRSTTSSAFARYRWGRAGDRPVVGDWNGNGTWTPGVLRDGARWYLKDSFTGSAAGLGLRKQTPGTPVVGDWDGSP